LPGSLETIAVDVNGVVLERLTLPPSMGRF
jgi:hypothetical protein